MNKEQAIVIVASDASDKELDDLIIATTRRVLREKRGFWLLISGFDSDCRDLWEIPGVATLCQRFVDSGFISVLEIGPDPTGKAFGSYQVWKMSRDEMQDGKYTMSRDELDEHMGVVEKCSERCESLLASYDSRHERN